MVRRKNSFPNSLSALLPPLPALRASLPDLRASLPDLRASLPDLRSSPQEGNSTVEMAATHCHKCELVMNRQGESRPSIGCKRCKNEFCNQCAKETVEICQMMKAMGKSFWTCGACEANDADLKAVVDSIKTIKKGQEEQKAEMRTIKNGQKEQRKESEKILEGLKAVEVVAKKLEQIETVQERHTERLDKHEEAIEKNSKSRDNEEKRIEKLEDRAEKVEKNNLDGLKRLEALEKKMNDGAIPDKNNGMPNIRLTNAVVREVREIEKREKNFMVWNIPEPVETQEEDQKKYDEKKVIEVLRELNIGDVTFVGIARMGEKGGRYPRKIRVILTSAEDCKKVLKKSESTQLANDVRLSRDKTFQERLEARLFRQENEEAQNDTSTQIGEGGGGGGGGGVGSRGRSRGRGQSRRGRGGRGSTRGACRTESRKRRNSLGDQMQPEAEEDDKKRRRVGQDRSVEALTETRSLPTPSAPPESLTLPESLTPAEASTPPESVMPPESLAPPESLTPPLAAPATPAPAHLQSVDGRPGTPHPRLAARESEATLNF